MMPLLFESADQPNNPKYLMPVDPQSNQKWSLTLVHMQELQSTSNMHSPILVTESATPLPLTVARLYPLRMTSIYLKPLTRLHRKCVFKWPTNLWCKLQQLAPFGSIWLMQMVHHTPFYCEMFTTLHTSLRICFRSTKCIRSIRLRQRSKAAMLNSILPTTCEFLSVLPIGASIYLQPTQSAHPCQISTNPCCGTVDSCTLVLPLCAAWAALFHISPSNAMILLHVTLVSGGVCTKSRLVLETSDILTHRFVRSLARLVTLESVLPPTYAVHFLKAIMENVTLYASTILTPNIFLSTAYAISPERQLLLRFVNFYMTTSTSYIVEWEPSGVTMDLNTPTPTWKNSAMKCASSEILVFPTRAAATLTLSEPGELYFDLYARASQSQTPPIVFGQILYLMPHTPTIFWWTISVYPHTRKYMVSAMPGMTSYTPLAASAITYYQHVTEPVNYLHERYPQFTLDPTLYVKAIKYIYLDFKDIRQDIMSYSMSTDITLSPWIDPMLPSKIPPTIPPRELPIIGPDSPTGITMRSVTTIFPLMITHTPIPIATPPLTTDNGVLTIARILSALIQTDTTHHAHISARILDYGQIQHYNQSNRNAEQLLVFTIMSTVVNAWMMTYTVFQQTNQLFKFGQTMNQTHLWMSIP